MKKILLLFSIFAVCFSLLSETLREKVEGLEIKASAGDAAAMYHLSTLYERGFDSIPADSVRSLRLLRLSAEKGYAPAQNYLGYKYVAIEKDSAIYWLSKAAEGGEKKAISNLAYLLLTPDSLESDSMRVINERRAADLLKRAASSGLPQASAMLADLYREGRGVERDTLQAELLYLDAVSTGLKDAERKLYAMNKEHYAAVSPDEALSEGLRAARAGAHTVAFILFNRAADGGDPKAYTLLGDAWSSAKGTDYNHREAMYNYIRGAEGGDPSAQFILAELLEIFPDALREFEEFASLPNTPSYWYEKASKGGVETAQEAIRELFKPIF